MNRCTSNIMEALGYYQADTTEVYLGDMELVLAMSISTIFWRGEWGLVPDL